MYYINILMKNILYPVVKITGIIYAVVLFSIFGMINAKILDYSFINDEDDDKDNQHTHIRNLLTILKLTICVAILCFIGRNIVERIPFIFENVHGFNYMRLKEVKSGSMLLFFSVMFSSAYRNIIKKI